MRAMMLTLVFVAAGGRVLMAGESGEPAASPAPASFWHIGLVVADMQRMHTFYSEVIGLEQVTDLQLADARLGTSAEGTIAVERWTN